MPNIFSLSHVKMCVWFSSLSHQNEYIFGEIFGQVTSQKEQLKEAIGGSEKSDGGRSVQSHCVG